MFPRVGGVGGIPGRRGPFCGGVATCKECLQARSGWAASIRKFRMVGWRGRRVWFGQRLEWLLRWGLARLPSGSLRRCGGFGAAEAARRLKPTPPGEDVGWGWRLWGLGGGVREGKHV